MLNNKLAVKKKKGKKQMKKRAVVKGNTSDPAVTMPQDADSSNSSFLSGYDPSEFEVIDQQDFVYESECSLKADIKDKLHINSKGEKKNKKEGSRGKKVDHSKNHSHNGKMLLAAGTSGITMNVTQRENLQTQNSTKKKKKKNGIENDETGPKAEMSARKRNACTNGVSTSSQGSKAVYVKTQESKKKTNKHDAPSTAPGLVQYLERSMSDSKKYDIATECNKTKKNVKSKKIGKKRKISDMFEEAEICMEEAVPKKIEEVKKMLMKGTKSAVLENTRQKEVQEKRPDYENLSFKKSRVDVDMSLQETADEGISSGLSSVQKISEKVGKAALPQETKLPDIDPNKFIPVKTQKLRTVVPSFEEGGDSESDEEEEQQHMNLMEAFADDDIADEFRKEKEKAEEESLPKTVDLRLPGWGEWGGIGIEQKKKSRWQNKQLLKFPGAPRRDQGKKLVIINDDPPSSFKQKQVDDLPSEFPSVAAYEASIRAPIGNTWVPQLAHDALTAAPVVTKMGAIIQPLDDSHLIKEDAEKEAQKKFNDSMKSGRPVNRFKHKARKPAGHSKAEGGHKSNFKNAKKRKAGQKY